MASIHLLASIRKRVSLELGDELIVICLVMITELSERPFSGLVMSMEVNESAGR